MFHCGVDFCAGDFVKSRKYVWFSEKYCWRHSSIEHAGQFLGICRRCCLFHKQPAKCCQRITSGGSLYLSKSPIFTAINGKNCSPVRHDDGCWPITDEIFTTRSTSAGEINETNA
ncbi:uncharacterized protein LOC126576980 [Anopheles aquasalis]|uniref:uncharacterized protein LOC126576980 n=1 Tax=Anopheles aquasalis TaxID=42839 RepID=UPI00215A3451|nr:uncharacterized protein LOC126576980 [Anopheles aquasalis]